MSLKLGSKNGAEVHKEQHSKNFKNTKISDNAIESLKTKFDKVFDSGKHNVFTSSVLSYLKEIDCPIAGIRCLGLGSLESEIYPLHQLCPLKQIVDQLSTKKDIVVSLWDPIFTVLDKEFIQSKLHYVVEEKPSFENDRNDILYYMPHFPIEEIEKILVNCEPLLLLTNDLQAYSLRLSSWKFLSLYPICASISFLSETENLANDDSQKAPLVSSSVGDFHFVKKKHRNRRKKGITPVLPKKQDYNLDTKYFIKACVKRFPYDTHSTLEYSLTDICFIKLTRRSTDKISN